MTANGTPATTGSRPLRIALPSKGRLAEPAYRLMSDAGIPVDTDGRRLRFTVGDGQAEILLVRSDDIPVLADDRAIDLGICGYNQLIETATDVVVRAHLGFGGCRLGLAVPKESPITSLADCAGIRIATSYPVSAAAFLAERGVSATLIPITGSVELAPSLDAAEAIIDLISTGETLRVNGLREAEVLLESDAVLISPAQLDEAITARAEAVLTSIKSVLAARPKRYLMANVADEASLTQVLAILPSIDSPTVLPLAHSGSYAVHAVVDRDEVIRLLTPLGRAGASGILVLPIENLIA